MVVLVVAVVAVSALAIQYSRMLIDIFGSGTDPLSLLILLLLLLLDDAFQKNLSLHCFKPD